jgi:hypothetical protein
VEAITRLVTESLARHGVDRPVDPRRLQWSHWFRCDSPRSLLVVPSKPGIFAIAEEVAAFDGASEPRSRNPERSEGSQAYDDGDAIGKRMLAVLQFSEDDDMAFTLDRMFTCENPMRPRLATGRCFLRFVVIQDQAQRRSICSALNQWMVSSAEKASGLPPDFASSIELTRVERASAGRTPLSANPHIATKPLPMGGLAAIPPQLDSGANTNLHCPHPLPSGF